MSTLSTGIAVAIFAIIGPMFYRRMDKMEERIRANWKDGFWKRLVLMSKNTDPISPEASDDTLDDQ